MKDSTVHRPLFLALFIIAAVVFCVAVLIPHAHGATTPTKGGCTCGCEQTGKCQCPDCDHQRRIKGYHATVVRLSPDKGKAYTCPGSYGR